MRGQFQFTDVEFVRPVFRLEILGDGRPNWNLKNTSQYSGWIDPEDIILDEVLITDGKVYFDDTKHKLAREISLLNAKVSARALIGPYIAEGQMVVDAQDYEFKLRAGRASAAGMRRLSFRTNAADREQGDENEQIVFEGTLDTSAENSMVTGKLSLQQRLNRFSFLKSSQLPALEQLTVKLDAEISGSLFGVRLEDI